MKTINKLLCISSILMICSCVEQMHDNNGAGLIEMEFSTVSEGIVKSYLNNDLSINWETGDLAGVYDGVEWREFEAQNEGPSTTLKGEALNASSYIALYPYDSKASYTSGAVKTTFPQVQTITGNCIAPNALLAVATSTDKTFSFKNVTSLLKMNLNAEDKIVKVELTSRGTESLAGDITVTISDKPGYTLENGTPSVSLEKDDKGILQGDIFMSVLPQNFESGIQLAFYNEEGEKAVKKYGPMEFIRNGGKDAGTIANLKWAKDLTARCIAQTSSTLTFEWTENGYNNVADDLTHPYTIALYTDAACENLVVSWDIAANNAIFTSTQPRFVFTGLASSTSYWFKVTDTADKLESITVMAATAAFTPVEVSGTAAEGQVILAEDFSQMVWGTEEYNVAAGYTTLTNSATEMTPASGVNPTENYKLIKAGDYSSLFDTFKNSVSTTRLDDWGTFCYLSGALTETTSKVIARGCHLMLNTWKGGTASLVTPALTSLTSLAKLRVTFKAAQYNGDDTNSKKLCISSLDPASTISDKHLVTFGTKSQLATVEINTVMTEYTAEISDVMPGSRIAIGPESTEGTKARFYIDDVKIELIEYVTYPIEAVLVAKSSSTATFKWSENGFTNLEEDLANNYTIGIYTDSNCQNALVTWNTDKATFTYKSTTTYQPCFVFTGLAQNTTYWFRVHDTTNDLYSNTVSITTDSFTIKEISESPVAQGGVVLAEDFSGLVWGSDEINFATGYESRTFGSDEYMTPATGNNPTDVYRFMPYGDYHSFHYWYKTPMRNTRYRDWSYLSYLNSALQNDGTSTADTAWDKKINARAGYVMLGTWSNGNGIIVTPPLDNLSGTATLTVAFKGARYSTDDHNGITAYKIDPKAEVWDTNLGIKTNATVTKGSVKWLHNNDEIVGVSGPALWKSFTVDLTDVAPGSRIGIGPSRQNGKGERMYIDDIVITVKSYNE